jgi:hypothetical protein
MNRKWHGRIKGMASGASRSQDFNRMSGAMQALRHFRGPPLGATARWREIRCDNEHTLQLAFLTRLADVSHAPGSWRNHRS